MTTLAWKALPFTLALASQAGAAPATAEAPTRGEARPRGFLFEGGLELGPWAGQARYSGPITGMTGESTERSDFAGLSEGVLFSLGYALTPAWIAGLRGGGMQIPGLSKKLALSPWSEESLSSSYIGAFARWCLQPAGGVWLEASAGAASLGFDERCCSTKVYREGVPADEDALRNGLWGPGGSLGIGYAIHDAEHIEWGPTLRAHGVYAASDHGRIMGLGLTLGLAFGLTNAP